MTCPQPSPPVVRAAQISQDSTDARQPPRWRATLRRMNVHVPSPLSPSDQPRCDRPICQISKILFNAPDCALWFTVIRASERFRGRVALSALSGPLPRSAITNASARNARHDAPRGRIRPRLRLRKGPASTSRQALNSSNLLRAMWRVASRDCDAGGKRY